MRFSTCYKAQGMLCTWRVCCCPTIHKFLSNALATRKGYVNMAGLFNSEEVTTSKASLEKGQVNFALLSSPAQEISQVLFWNLNMLIFFFSLFKSSR